MDSLGDALKAHQIEKLNATREEALRQAKNATDEGLMLRAMVLALVYVGDSFRESSK